jgi:hypothetical protein
LADEAGDISARARQACHEAIADRVGDGRKYDRDRPRLPLECSGRWSSVREDYVGSLINLTLKVALFLGLFVLAFIFLFEPRLHPGWGFLFFFAAIFLKVFHRIPANTNQYGSLSGADVRIPAVHS